MANNVMIMHEGTGFLTDSLVDAIKHAGLEPLLIEANVEQVIKARVDTTVVIIIADDYIRKAKPALAAVRDCCIEDEAALCVIGYDKDLALIEGMISPQLIAAKFKRPFEMKELIAKVKRLDAAERKRGDISSILLVDDDPQYLKTMLKFLEDKYEVTAVRAGHHALKYLQTNHPDLILLDNAMPAMSGTETFKEIRKHPEFADIPVVFLTGANDKQSVVEIMQLRPDGYLLKNVGRYDLLDSIRTIFLSIKWKKIK